MNDKVRRFIEENRLLQHGDKVIVALSGGADSVSLLHVLISLKEEFGLSVGAAHFHHGIRGAEADRDEMFCRSLCARYDIPFTSQHADVPAAAAQMGESEELCGRRLRYDFLQACSRAAGGAKIATAHNLDDNTETVLLHLLRGTGIGGLCGIPLRRGNIIRPLLHCSRAEIETYCRENALEYITDSTNLSDVYTRNKLRLQVLPVLRQMNPALDEGILRMTAVMRDADEYFKNISNLELKEAKNVYGYACDQLLMLDAPVLPYAVKHILEASGAPVDHRHIALVIGAMREGGAVTLGGGYTADCVQGTLRILHREEPSDAEDTFCVPLLQYAQEHCDRIVLRGGQIQPAKQDSKKIEKIHNLLFKHGIPCAIISSDTVVRHRRAGDTFTDARRGVTKTLKKLLNELKIPREQRDKLLVAAQGSVVLWLEGCGTSLQGQVQPSCDGEVIIMGNH